MAGDGIGTASVDDDRADAFSGAFPKNILADCDWGGGKGVLGKDSGSGAGSFGCYESQVRETCVACFDADMSSGYEEAFGVGP